MIYTTCAVVACLSLQAVAFPFVADTLAQKRQDLPTASSLLSPKQISQNRGNCGVIDCLTFDQHDQLVSVTGDHAYASPAVDEIRGPCPGLNAAANHGYLSRSGVTNIVETVEGLLAAYGMGPGLSGFLAGYAVIMTGDPIMGTWSIGGPYAPNALTTGLLGKPQGISYAHNTYESDMSIGRPDAYLNNGDAHSLDTKRFADTYRTGLGLDRFTLDGFAQEFSRKGQQSIEENPLFFSAPFSGILVAPAAYNFVINLMSNHSSSEPSGYLNGEIFKSFFAVTGDYPNFTWNKGQERIPENWYRRPTISPYDIPNADSDVSVQYAAYPESLRLGGNIDGVNTYVGVSLEDLTGGVVNAKDVTDTNSNGPACFFAQIVQSALPDLASIAVAEASAIMDIVNEQITSVSSGLDCPTVDRYDQTLFNKFPGYKYNPNGSDNPIKGQGNNF